MATAVDLQTYKDALILLGTAGVVVPIVHRFQVSPIFGYLVAGVLLGPNGLGLLADTVPILRWITVSSREGVAHIAELGVVFLLFLIGLELSFKRLMALRRLLLGFGGMQVAISTAVIALVAIPLTGSTAAGIVIAAALALSSTAIVIEILSRQHRLATHTGRATFAVLLFQDLAVVPLLLLVDILGAQENGSVVLSVARALAQAAAALVIIVILGRFVMRPMFRAVAATQSHELFMAATLFVAVGTSLVSAAAGMSMALGAFVAGLMLAETEFRRAIEATIEPFKGLLLGMFFFSVGMNLDVKMILAQPSLLLAAAVGLIVVKGAVVLAAGRLLNLPTAVRLESALLVAPGGEFAFVLLGLAMATKVVSPQAGQFALTVAVLTMAMLPALAALARTLTRAVAPVQLLDADAAEAPPDDRNRRAIIVGYGRVGELVVDMLQRHGVPYLASDRDAQLVGQRRRAGKSVYYGDARQALFLQRCGIETASALIITIHTQSDIDEIVRMARVLRPDLPIVSRARDAEHASHLYELGVTDAVPETIEASLQLSEAALVQLGVPAGPVIASIHEKRDEFRHNLQGVAAKAGQTTRAIRPSRQGAA